MDASKGVHISIKVHKFLLDFWKSFCYGQHNEADGTQEGQG